MKRIIVKDIIKSRYPDNKRPLKWEDRREGIDLVIASDGKEYSLFSSGQQSPPPYGSEILLMNEVEDSVFTWTLYKLPPMSYGNLH